MADDTFRGYFETFGNIVDAVVMKDRETNRTRGFGFIQFDNPGPVDDVMSEYDNHQILGKWIEVKRSVPKEDMGGRDMGGRGPPPRSSPYGAYGGGGGAYGGGGYGGGSSPYGRPPQGGYGGYQSGAYG